MQLLVNGEAAFKEILNQIDQAKRCIQIRMFVWRDDTIGNLVLRHLFDASKRGVKITIWKDRYAEILEKGEENKQSLFHKPYTPLSYLGTLILDIGYPMNKPKGYRQKPNPLLAAFLGQANVTVHAKNYRDHSKFYFIDESVLIFGGINIEDKEYHVDYLHRRYHDYMVMISEPSLIRQFQEQFFEGKASSSDVETFVINRPKQSHIAQSMIQLIDQANERIIITMAYLSAKSCLEALKRACARGVFIDIFTSAYANLQKDYNRYFLKQLYQYNPKQITIRLGSQMVHGKVIISDQTCSIGSANMNNKGFYKLGECNFVTQNKTIIDQILRSRDHESRDAVIVKDANELSYSKFRAYFEYFAT